MTHKATRVNNYNFTSKDKLFLDANIWLYLYGPQSPKAPNQVRIYSQAFKCILKAKSRIYIDVLVISEFINTYARIIWRNKAMQKEFKDFRKSSYFKPVAQDIAADVKRIIKHCSRVESNFTTLKIDDVIDDYAKGHSDFNDQVITELCKNKGLMLITHDGDFRGRGISVLTANRSLLV